MSSARKVQMRSRSRACHASMKSWTSSAWVAIWPSMAGTPVQARKPLRRTPEAAYRPASCSTRAATSGTSATLAARTPASRGWWTPDLWPSAPSLRPRRTCPSGPCSCGSVRDYDPSRANDRRAGGRCHRRRCQRGTKSGSAVIDGQREGAAMTLTDTSGRATANGKLADISIRTDQLDWVHFGGGIEFKPLRVTPENGTGAVLFNSPAGSSFAAHRHFGAGEYLVLSGLMKLRGGEEAGGVTARAGDYGYEANSVYHYQTNFPEQTVLYFQNHGPIGFLDEEDNVVGVLD